MLITNALIFGLLLSFILSMVIVISFSIASDMWVGDYPPDVKEKYGEMSSSAKKYRPIIAGLFFGAVVVVPILAIGRLRSLTNGDLNFLDYFFSTFITLMVFNVFDLLVVDWLIFVYLQPKAIVLPGTEGMQGYDDYWFHFRGFLIGIAFSLGGAFIISLITWIVFRLF